MHTTGHGAPSGTGTRVAALRRAAPVTNHVVTTDATVADTELTDVIHQGLTARKLLPDEHDVDAGYVTAAHIVTARDEYGIELVGPVGLDTCHENHESEHFTQSAFSVDRQARKVTCPEGKISAGWSDQRKSSVRTRIRRTRYTCLPKTHLGHVFAATAINIIRLDAWLTETPLGETRTSHLARLDPAA